MDILLNRKHLGEAIREQREAQGLSQHRLALMIGTGKSYIWRVENGHVSIGLDALSRIAEALGVEVSSLVDF